jgi:hypothetical protein
MTDLPYRLCLSTRAHHSSPAHRDRIDHRRAIDRAGLRIQITIAQTTYGDAGLNMVCGGNDDDPLPAPPDASISAQFGKAMPIAGSGAARARERPTGNPHPTAHLSIASRFHPAL